MDNYWGNNTEVETPITQMQIGVLSISRHRIVCPVQYLHETASQGIWTSKDQYWDNEVEPGENAEFLSWEEQLLILAETTIGRRYFNTAGDKNQASRVCCRI